VIGASSSTFCWMWWFFSSWTCIESTKLLQHSIALKLKAVTKREYTILQRYFIAEEIKACLPSVCPPFM
jgi:hypothetical protein